MPGIHVLSRFKDGISCAANSREEISRMRLWVVERSTPFGLVVKMELAVGIVELFRCRSLHDLAIRLPARNGNFVSSLSGS